MINACSLMCMGLLFFTRAYSAAVSDSLCPAKEGYIRILVYWNDWGSLGQGTLSKADVVRLSKWLYRRRTVCRVREQLNSSLLLPLQKLREKPMKALTSDCRVVIVVESPGRNDTLSLATASQIEYNGVFCELSKDVYMQIVSLMPYDQAVRMLRDTSMIRPRE